MHGLKGFICLLDCSTSDNPTRPNTFILVTNHKKYILSSIAMNTSSDLNSWRNSIDYSIEHSKNFSDVINTSGWLLKKGGIGHKHQNWKKRWFVLRGNVIFYYEEKKENLKNLKGFIEISKISDLDADFSSNSIGFQFTITVNNDKSFLLATKTIDDKNQWIYLLRTCIATISRLNTQVPLNVLEKEYVVKFGELKRWIELKKSRTSFFILSNINLRTYSTKIDIDRIEESWAKNLVECIPLLGCSIQCVDDNEEWQLKTTEMALIQIQGHAYCFEAKTEDERKDWVSSIRKTSRLLAQKIIESGEKIRLTSNVFDKNGTNVGYTIMNIDKTNLTLRYLMLKKKVIIPFSDFRLVYSQASFLFCIKYYHQANAKQLKMKCGNANGIFEVVDAVFEMLSKDQKLIRRGYSLTHKSVIESDEFKLEKVERSEKITKKLLLSKNILNQDQIDINLANSQTKNIKNSKNKVSLDKDNQEKNSQDKNNEKKDSQDKNASNPEFDESTSSSLSFNINKDFKQKLSQIGEDTEPEENE